MSNKPWRPGPPPAGPREAKNYHLQAEFVYNGVFGGIWPPMNENQDQGPPGFPDRVAYLEDGWAVRFRGEVQAPRWNDRGPALAFLDLVQRGLTEPDPEPHGKTAQDFRFEIDPKYVNEDQHQIDSHPCKICGERYIDHDGREFHRYVPAPTAS